MERRVRSSIRMVAKISKRRLYTRLSKSTHGGAGFASCSENANPTPGARDAGNITESSNGRAEPRRMSFRFCPAKLVRLPSVFELGRCLSSFGRRPPGLRHVRRGRSAPNVPGGRNAAARHRQGGAARFGERGEL